MYKLQIVFVILTQLMFFVCSNVFLKSIISKMVKKTLNHKITLDIKWKPKSKIATREIK